MRYGAKASLWDFYNYVRTVTTFTHPNMYGHLEMGKEKIAQFLDYKLVPRKQSAAQSSMLESLALNAVNDANDQMLEREMNEEVAEESSHQLEGLFDFLNVEKNDDFDQMSDNGVSKIISTSKLMKYTGIYYRLRYFIKNLLRVIMR